MTGAKRVIATRVCLDKMRALCRMSDAVRKRGKEECVPRPKMLASKVTGHALYIFSHVKFFIKALASFISR